MAAVDTGFKRSFREMSGTDQESPVSITSSVRSGLCQFYNGTPTTPSSTSARQSPEIEHATGHNGHFLNSRASIVLIGICGVGKSSLGILAATAYHRRIIEMDRIFLAETGSSPTAFRKSQGCLAYHKRHQEIFQNTLQVYEKDCVIVCTFADLEHDGARVLQQYARSHPVVHVSRDFNGIHAHLQQWSAEKVKDFVQASKPLLRACTNFEFFNVSEDMEKSSPNSDHSGQPLKRLARGPFLTLKRAEHDFLKFLRNVLGDSARHLSHHSVYPLTQVRLEDMEYPSAVKLSAADIVAQKLDLDEAQVGVDAIELEVSIDQDDTTSLRNQTQSHLDLASEAFAILRRSTILPIITSVTCHNPPDRHRVQEIAAIEHCLRLGPDYCRVDLSFDKASLTRWIGKKGRTQLIGSSATPQRFKLGWQDPQCRALYERARQIGFDFIDLSMPAGHEGDPFDALMFSKTIRNVPSMTGPTLTAYSTGKRGQSSMCFNPSLTPVRAASQSHTSTALVTSRQRNQAIFAALIYEPLQFFVYGRYVRFSLSPAMHNAAYEACGMSHSYGVHKAFDLSDLAEMVRKEDFGGASIVQPFKTTTLLLMDQLSPHAKAIGAVNTIIPIRDGIATTSDQAPASIPPGRNRSGRVKALYGDNTDWIGIRSAIRQGLSPANTIRPHTTAVVCGAGGMARSAIYSLITLGVKTVFICNRSHEHALVLAEHYNNLVRTKSIGAAASIDTDGVRIETLASFNSPWPNDVRFPTMIVSCIPTRTGGGEPTNFTLPIDWLASPTGGVVVELAYMPVTTPLVQQVTAFAHKGWILMDGLDVLPEQAFAQFELFTGRRAPRKLMREQVFKNYNQHTLSRQDAAEW